MLNIVVIVTFIPILVSRYKMMSFKSFAFTNYKIQFDLIFVFPKATSKFNYFLN